MKAHPLAYLLVRRLRNRIRSGLRKLRQPKFLLGLILVTIYFSWILVGRAGLRSMDRGERHPIFTPLFIDVIAPLGLMFVAGVAWVFTGWKKAHPLRFEKSDVEMLFAMPIPRRALVAYSLSRFQLWVIFSTVVMGVFLSRSLSPFTFLGWYLMLSIAHLHTVGIAFAHGTPWSAGRARVAFAWLPGIVLAAGIAGGIVTAGIDIHRLFSLSGLEEVERVCSSGLLAVLLAPFRMVLALPTTGHGSSAPFTALGWSLIIFLIHVGWVFLQDSAFEEASLRGAEARRARLEAWRKGKIGFFRPAPKGAVKRQPFRLAQQGPPVWAFLWKGLLSTGRFYSIRNLAVACAAAFTLGLWLQSLLPEIGPGFPKTGALIAGQIALMIYMMVLFRRSQEGLGMIESMTLLKLLPLRGSTVFAGSVFSEVGVFMGVYLIVWVLAAASTSTFLIENAFYGVGLVLTSFAAMGVLVALASAVRLCIALWLPFTATLQTGPAAMGHNFLVLITRELPIHLLLLPPGIVVGFLVFALGPVRFMPIACIVAGGAVAAAEVYGVVRIGGWLYDRFDVAAE